MSQKTQPLRPASGPVTAESSQDAILQRIGELPPAPVVVVKLITLAEDPRVMINRLVEVVRYDQALTARLLRLCSSSFMGLREPVEDLREAIWYLGTTTVRKVALLSQRTYLLHAVPEAERELQKSLWEHAAAVALASQRLAEKVGGVAPGAAFTAGVFHDLGMFALHEYVDEDSEPSLEPADDSLSHAEIGARIAQHWDLPGYVVQAIRYHHAPSLAGEFRRIASVIHVADIVARRAGLGVLPVGEIEPALESGTLDALSLAQGDVQELVLALPGDLLVAKKMLSLSGG